MDVSPIETARRNQIVHVLRRHVDKLKPRRARSPRDSDDEAPRKYERLERAVKRQLSRGHAARRRLSNLKRMIKRPTTPSGYASDNGKQAPQSEESSDDEVDERPLVARDAVDAAKSRVDWLVPALVLTAIALVSDAAKWAIAASLVCQLLAVRLAIVDLASSVVSSSNHAPQPRKKLKSPRKDLRAAHWQVPKVQHGDGNSWWNAPNFSLRGPKYLQDKQKQPSDPAFYEPAAVHVFQCAAGSVNHILDARPDLLPLSDDPPAGPSCRLPTFVAFNISVPTEAPSVRGWFPGNPCWSILCIFRITDATRSVAQRPPADWPNALRLLKTWLDTANTDHATNNRLKGIFFCRAAHDDDDDDGQNNKIPPLLQKWNGRPVLMAENASGFSRQRKGISKLAFGANYAEVNINVGESFSYMGRGAVYLMLRKLEMLEIDVCFTIEGRSNDELPETCLGALTFSRLRLSERFSTL